MKILKSVIRPKSRRGKITLATVIGLLASLVGINISNEMVFPSLGSPTVHCNHSTTNCTQCVKP